MIFDNWQAQRHQPKHMKLDELSENGKKWSKTHLAATSFCRASVPSNFTACSHHGYKYLPISCTWVSAHWKSPGENQEETWWTVTAKHEEITSSPDRPNLQTTWYCSYNCTLDTLQLRVIDLNINKYLPPTTSKQLCCSYWYGD